MIMIGKSLFESMKKVYPWNFITFALSELDCFGFILDKGFWASKELRLLAYGSSSLSSPLLY